MTSILTESDKLSMIKIEEAFKNCEFKTFYQPQYDSVTGRLVSAEALARWIKPDGTLVPTVKFIPVAEKTNLILKIDWYILTEVCRFIKKRCDENHRCVAIAINFSRKHISEPDFKDRLCEAVESYGIPRELIEVELTESALMRDSNAIIKFVSEIRNKGFNVAIDDFGSGLS